MARRGGNRGGEEHVALVPTGASAALEAGTYGGPLDDDHNPDSDSWLICIVGKVGEHDAILKEIQEVVLAAGGLKLMAKQSVQHDETLILIKFDDQWRDEPWRDPDQRTKLQIVAQQLCFLIECDAEKLKAMCEEKDLTSTFMMPAGEQIAPIVIPDTREECAYPPYQHMFAEYQVFRPKEDGKVFPDVYAEVWKRDTFTQSAFGTVSRLRLLHAALELPRRKGGCGFDLQAFNDQGLAVYALHTDSEREQVEEKWLGWCKLLYQTTVGSQPINELNVYFGPKLTLYIAFLGSVCRWLIGLGFVGTAVQVAAPGEENMWVAFFAVMVAIWSALFTEFWKRREAGIALEWGMSDFEQKEEMRVAYRNAADALADNKTKKSVVTGKEEPFVPWRVRYPKMIFSSVTIFICILGVGALNVYLYWLKLRMKASSNEFLSTWYSYIFSAMLSVSISVVNVLYTNVAVKLTEAECHRTDTEFTDSLIFKLFIVQFINSYASLYYVAFIMKHVEGDCDGYDDCMEDLTVLVSTILAERLIFTLVYDNLLPRFLAHRRFVHETRGTTEHFTLPERQFVLDPLDKDMEIVNRFMDQILMFGYMVLFVTAFPMAPFVGFISNVFQLKQFGHTLLYLKRRVIPSGVQDIGTFQFAFEVVAEVAVATNSALVFFTMKDQLLPEWSTLQIVWAFFLIQVTIFKCLDLIRQIIPDVPTDVEIQLMRQEYLRKKIFERVADLPDDTTVADDKAEEAEAHGINKQHGKQTGGFKLPNPFN